MAELDENLRNLANTLKNMGSDFNGDLMKEYRDLERELKLTDADQRIELAMIQGMTWLVKGLNDSRGYTKELYGNLYPIEKCDDDKIKFYSMKLHYSGTNKHRVKDGLTFYKERIFNDASPEDLVKDPKNLLRKLKIEYPTFTGTGHWIAMVPFKIMAINGLFPKSTNLNELEVPLGQYVRKGIEYLTGIEIDETRKTDIEIAQQIHRRFAELADTDIYTINSGIWLVNK